MTLTISPIACHLAEEIHQNRKELGVATNESAFHSRWLEPTLLPSFQKEFDDISSLKQIRSKFNTQIESLRNRNVLGSSLESEVDIFVPNKQNNIKYILDRIG